MGLSFHVMVNSEMIGQLQRLQEKELNVLPCFRFDGVTDVPRQELKIRALCRKDRD